MDPHFLNSCLIEIFKFSAICCYCPHGVCGFSFFILGVSSQLSFLRFTAVNALHLTRGRWTYFSRSSLSLFYFFNFDFILEHGSLTMLCSFQVYSKVIQLYIYMYLFFFKFNPTPGHISGEKHGSKGPVFLTAGTAPAVQAPRQGFPAACRAEPAS